MEKITMLFNYVAVSNNKKGRQKSGMEGLLVDPEISDSSGIVTAIGPQAEDPLKEAGVEVGSKVYVGPKREQVRFSGSDLMIMTPENIMAVVHDNEKKTEEEQSTQA